MRTLTMLLVFLGVWCVAAGFAATYLGKLFNVNIQSDETRTRQLMNRRAKLDINEALGRD